MSTTPANPFVPGCTPAIQQARQDRLDALYLQDGRHNSDHPLHAHYTGLWQQYHDAPCTDEAAA